MKEVSKFYSSLGLLIILNVIIKPVWIFGIDRQVQNTVGTEVYGAYFSLLGISVVFSFLSDWGLTVFFNRQLAAEGKSFTAKTGGFLLIKLLFAALYTAVVFAVALLSGVKQLDILLSVIIIQVLTSLFVFLRSIVTAQQWFSTDAWLSVLDKGLMILLCGSFLYWPSLAGEMTISKFLLVQISCTAIAVLCVFILLLKRGTIFSFKTNALFDRQVLKAALPFAIIVLLMSVHNRLDVFLLERLHTNGAYEAGLYAGAYRLLDAANMIGYLVASFLLPFIARHQSQQRNISEAVLNSRHLLMIFSLTIVITTIFLAPWLQAMLYHHNDARSADILQWCLPALFGYLLVTVYGTVMTATGNVTRFCYITFFSVVLNIVLNLFLIPRYGAKGCCIAALASQVFCGLAAMLFVQKNPGINIHFRSVLRYVFMAAILCVYYYCCEKMFTGKWLLIAGSGLIAIAGAIFLKLVDISKWRRIIKAK